MTKGTAADGIAFVAKKQPECQDAKDPELLVQDSLCERAVACMFQGRNGETGICFENFGVRYQRQDV